MAKGIGQAVRQPCMQYQLHKLVAREMQPSALKSSADPTCSVGTAVQQQRQIDASQEHLLATCGPLLVIRGTGCLPSCPSDAVSCCHEFHEPHGLQHKPPALSRNTTWNAELLTLSVLLCQVCCSQLSELHEAEQLAMPH